MKPEKMSEVWSVVSVDNEAWAQQITGAHKILLKRDETMQHIMFCCPVHGCSFGDKHCLVVEGKLESEADCSECEMEWEKDFAFNNMC